VLTCLKLVPEPINFLFKNTCHKNIVFIFSSKNNFQIDMLRIWHHRMSARLPLRKMFREVTHLKFEFNTLTIIIITGVLIPYVHLFVRYYIVLL